MTYDSLLYNKWRLSLNFNRCKTVKLSLTKQNEVVQGGTKSITTVITLIKYLTKLADLFCISDPISFKKRRAHEKGQRFKDIYDRTVNLTVTDK